MKKINERITIMDHTEVWIKFEEIKEILGADELLECIAQALSTDELEENLRYIDRTQDLNVF